METQLTCAIVDDEILAVETIKILLSEYCPNSKLIWTACSYDEAWKSLDNQSPDILFLDIEMPGKSGFDLLRDYPERDFEVIFITAYNQYAIQAFKYSAIDYLLKPIDVDQLKSAIERASVAKSPNREIRYKALKDNLEGNKPTKIVITSNENHLYLDVEDLLLLDGEGSYTTIFCVGGTKYTTTKKISEIVGLLNPKQFFRCHKSQVVALKHILSYNKVDSSIILKGGLTAILARRKRQEFIDIMQRL
ncbi:MAG: LytTR family DNA-binding domain-containing protein [Salinivirgaceae bacterium]|nr:LytTR family DNA-binding domain-containing protein [Salinivirgaceae bacterium]